jgi:transposase
MILKNRYKEIMYIKKVRKQNKGSKRIYDYLHLVENIRTEKGPRQRLILNLGALNIAEVQYKELANCIEGMLSGQQSLFSADRKIEKYARDAVRRILEKTSRDQAIPGARKAGISGVSSDYQMVDVSSFEAAEPRSIGPEHVCHEMWKRLGINDVLLSKGVSSRQLPLLEALVVGRLVAPGSERCTQRWAEGRSAIYELVGIPLRGSLNSFYRASDTLFKCKEELETHLAQCEAEMFSLPECMCFFDLTNTYLEGRALRNRKAKRGHSKEKRTDCKLLTLALIVDEQGFAKYSHLYPGNQHEPKTLSEMIESLVAARPNLARHRTVIMDAGIATEEAIEYLRENRFHYIVVNRSKAGFTSADAEDMKVIAEDKSRDFRVEVARREESNETWLLCRSTGRLKKDTGIRHRQEEIFLERLAYFKAGLTMKNRTKKYTKIMEIIGRLREKYPRASKLYDVTVVPDKNQEPEKTNAADIVWRKRTRYDDNTGLEGCYVLRTDRTDLSDQEIWKTYVMLTRIEKAFRSLKSSLGLRPNFHQLEWRADAHMFISVLAYHILHTIEYQLRSHGDNRSWDTIRETLSTHQRLTIEYTVKEQDSIQRHHLRLCSRPEMEHQMIYQRLGLSDLPLSRKSVSVK